MIDTFWKWWSTLVQRSLPLAYLGLGNAILLGALVIPAMVDDQQITGANRWLKPMKFAASIAVYAWTMAWLLGYLQRAPGSVRGVGWSVTIFMSIEVACVVMQAARGRISHFNMTTALDGAVFSVMGLLILLNTFFVIYTFILFCVTNVELPAAYLWSIRLGMLIFIAASMQGFAMVAHSAHTVGQPDGGPGLPLVNWSTSAGDLRVPHFIGLHALQILPILGYWLSQRRRTPLLSPQGWIAVIAVSYAVLVAGLYVQAAQGQPLIRLQAASAG